MKTVRVINTLGFGGVEKVFEIVAKYYEGDKKNIIFLVLGKGGAAEKVIRQCGYRVVLFGYRTKIPNIRLILRLVTFFRNEKPDVVHTAGAEANFHGIIAAFLAGVPVRVAEEIGMPAHSPKAKVIFRLVYRLASRVIAVAHLVEKYLLDTKEVSPFKITVLYNPVDVRSFSDPRVDRSDGVFRLISVCRLEPVKNLDFLLKAFSEVCTEEGQRMELWIIGEGSERKKLEDLVLKLDVGSRITFWGYQEQPGLFLKDASLFVLPSLSEGLPVSLAEAMLTGTPCVATRIGGAPEFMENGVNGWLIDPYDREAFVGLLRTMIEMPAAERQQVGRRGKETVKDKFMPEQYLDRIGSLYQELYTKASLK